MNLFQWLYSKVKGQVLSLWNDSKSALAEDKLGCAIVDVAAIIIMAMIGILSVYVLLLLIWIHRINFFWWVLFPLGVIFALVIYFEKKTPEIESSSDNSLEDELVRQRAEEAHDFVRDATYSVIVDVSEYTPLVRPASPSAIETNVRIYVREHVAFFQFNCPISDTVDANDLRERLQTRLTQKLRGHELPGIPSEMVIWNRHPYAPLQVYSVSDTGASVNIDLFFADDVSIPLLEAKARARLERQRQNSYRDNDFK